MANSGGGGGGGGDGNGGGSNGGKPSPPCTVVKEFVDALCRFLVVDCDQLAVPLFLAMVKAPASGVTARG